jgi:hypothetical protein
MKRKHAGGRPAKIDKTCLAKLEDAFSNALPDDEACLYAGINPATLYRYQQKNPKFSERKEALKLTPNIAARKTIIATLGDVRVAQWWLEKKDPAMKPTSKVEHTVEMTDITEKMSDEEKAALVILREARRKRIEAESDKQN